MFKMVKCFLCKKEQSLKYPILLTYCCDCNDKEHIFCNGCKNKMEPVDYNLKKCSVCNRGSYYKIVYRFLFLKNGSLRKRAVLFLLLSLIFIMSLFISFIENKKINNSSVYSNDNNNTVNTKIKIT